MKHKLVNYTKLFLFLFGLGLCSIGRGQTVKLQVVTKTIEKQFDWELGETVILEGEKSSIKVQNWSGRTIKVILKQMAKAPSRAVAEKELAYQKHILEKRRSGIRFKNYFVIPKNIRETQSILKSEYEVWLPKNCPIDIVNSYGNVVMKNASGAFSIDNKYGNIVLENVDARLNLKSYFGDLTVNGFRGKVEGNCNHTLINLVKATGEWKLKTTLGDVLVGKASKFRKLEIDASKADVTLEQIDWQSADIQFESKYGDIIVPVALEKFFTEHSETNKELVKQYKSASNQFKISTTFGKIVAE